MECFPIPPEAIIAFSALLGAALGASLGAFLTYRYARKRDHLELKRVSTPCLGNVRPFSSVYQPVMHVRPLENRRICNVSPLDRPYFAPKRSKTGFHSRSSLDRRPFFRRLCFVTRVVALSRSPGLPAAWSRLGRLTSTLP